MQHFLDMYHFFHDLLVLHFKLQKKRLPQHTAFMTNAMDGITLAVQEAGMTIDTSVPLPDSL